MSEKASSEREGAFGRDAWFQRMAQIGAEHGLYGHVGKSHLGLFLEEGPTLLIAFDRADRAWSQSYDGLPSGFEMVRQRSWSLLSLMAIGQTWFRDPAIARFFRTLSAGGSLSDYSNVVFYGVGPECGFAACVYSSMIPGARVLAANPVATLNHADAPFERRYRGARKLEFSGPLGHAPRALHAASDALILYDPTEAADAAQAALFDGANTTRVGLPYAGRDFMQILHEEEGCVPVLRLLARGTRAPAQVRSALKVSVRENAGTMVRRTRAALVQGRTERAAILARHGLAATGDRRLAALLSETDTRRIEDRAEATIA